VLEAKERKKKEFYIDIKTPFFLYRKYELGVIQHGKKNLGGRI
jgi:hypothetical protein